jgi:hypothetical protein
VREPLSGGEITKNAVQHTLTAGLEAIASVSSILTGAARDVVDAMGGFATEVIEIRDAVRLARAEHGEHSRDEA